MNSQAIVEVNRSTLTVLSSKISLASGGLLCAKGTVGLGEHRTLNFEGAGNSIHLKSFFNLLGWDVRWEGKTDAQFSLKGLDKDKKMVFLFDGQHEGFGPFPEKGNLSGSATWENGEWDLSGIKVESGSGYAKLLKGSRAFVDAQKSGRLHLVLDARNLHAGVITFFGGVELTGSWKNSENSEEQANLVKEFDVFARSLWINQFFLNGNITHMSLRKGAIEFSPIVGAGQQVSGFLNYEKFPSMQLKDLRLVENGKERFYMDGEIGTEKWDFNLRAKDIDANIIRALFDTTWPTTGPMEIKMVGKGSVHDPDINADVVWRNGSFGILPLDNANCHLAYKNGVVLIDNFLAVKKKGYQLSGKMKFGTGLNEKSAREKTDIDVKIEKGDLSFLKQVWKECKKSKGSFEGELKLGESRGERLVSGFFRVHDAQLETDSYIPQMKKGELEFSFEKNILKVVKGRAKMNHGFIELTGQVQFDQAL